MTLSNLTIPLLILGTIIYYSISKKEKPRNIINNSNSLFFLMTKHACGWGDRLVGH